MKIGVVLMTLISALLFCLIMVLASLSPFADSGPFANEFNSLGMWLTIGIVITFYILPLILYRVGVNAMKYVMAVFCGFGLFIAISIIAGAFVMGAVAGNTSDFLGVNIFCIVALVANVIWYIVAFRKTESLHTPNL